MLRSDHTLYNISSSTLRIVGIVDLTYIWPYVPRFFGVQTITIYNELNIYMTITIYLSCALHSLMCYECISYSIRIIVSNTVIIGLLAELTRKWPRPSTQSSENHEPHQSVAKKSLPDYTTIKMDLLAQDISDLRFASDPKVIIKLLYGNALTPISDLLKPHLKAVKRAACRFLRLGVYHVAVSENIIESADSIDSLMSRMSVGGMWDQTRFLRRGIASIPHSAPERGIAEAVLSHYHLHLAIYERTTLLKDALTEKSES